MKWTVKFYNQNIYDNFMAWPVGIKSRFMRIVKMIEEYGPNLGMPYTKSIKDGLFEIRSKSSEGIGRAFFCYVKSRHVVILHGFIKKTEKTPAKELEIARRRMREVKDYEVWSNKI